MQSRFRSKVAWMAILTLVLFILKTYFKIDVPQGDLLVQLILAVAVAVGIFNNPKDKKGW